MRPWDILILKTSITPTKILFMVYQKFRSKKSYMYLSTNFLEKEGFGQSVLIPEPLSFAFQI